MSRTKKGAKGAGYEYWSKRPNSVSPPGRKSKKITHKKERAQNKDITKRELKDDKFES